MSGLAEIQVAIRQLPPQEKARLWEWWLSEEIEEDDAFLAKLDASEASMQRQGGIPAEEARRRIASWITK